MARAQASRAVRAPSRIDREFFSPAAPPFVIAGGPDFESEVSNVYELGYRAQATRELSFSITGFYHDHLLVPLDDVDAAVEVLGGLQ